MEAKIVQRFGNNARLSKELPELVRDLTLGLHQIDERHASVNINKGEIIL